MKVGFLIIDMQTIHLENLDNKIINRACEYINYVSDVLRRNGHVVVHVQDIEGMDESNKDLFRTIPEIRVDAKDLILTKEHSSAFWKTDLERTLSDQNVELIIISGFAAEQCVLFTYNGAVERGFKPVMLQNGILSNSPDVITTTYRDRNVISYPVVEYLIHK
ncbi:isochorismatase family cysteine hydrolase [Paenibacillus sp. VCA1]|uniref:cysteine hydrolase family protein n=1 Tax=Paenibacillus sp. VCA1 TaxID=3039148 RepID=UPI0028724CD7|nr:isochorismatase family cysteine hydrolase [Paenibacillus sp. VCA1]MDR9854272.1 isochorismatase family cysteine hydrolase [Paenibacillus sp. VCA1]